MRSAWTLAALAACAPPPIAGAGSSSGASSDDSSGSPTLHGESTAIPTTAPSTSEDMASTANTTGAAETTGDEPCVDGELRPCFTGPPEAAGIPPCHPGTQQCMYPGKWGPCWEEVLPTQQDCATPEDETCSGVAPACAGGLGWVQTFTIDSDVPFGGGLDVSMLAVAANGDIVASGMYGGTIDFGGSAITSIGEVDVWIARFAPDGAPIWFRRFGGGDPTPNEDYSIGGWAQGNIVFDPGGDILLTSKCIDIIDFGDGPLEGEPLDPIVVRLTSAGEVKWAHRYTSDGYGDYALYIAPAVDGRVWLAGTVDSLGIDLGGGELHSAGWGDVLMAQLDADGEHLWSRRAGDAGHQEVDAIARAPDGGLVIAGTLEGSLDLGDGPLTSVGLSDAFVARLDSAGQPVWTRHYGDKQRQLATDVRVDLAGAVFLAGRFEAVIDLGGGPFVSPPDEDPYSSQSWYTSLFFARLTSTGTHVWSTALDPDQIYSWQGVGVSTLDDATDGSVVIAGGGDMPLMFPGEVWGSGGGPWVATLGPEGGPRWQHILTDDEFDWPLAVAGPDGTALVAMTIYGEVEFGGKMVGVADKASLILAQLGP